MTATLLREKPPRLSAENRPASLYEATLAAAVDAAFREKGLEYAAEPAKLSPIPAQTDISAAQIGADLLGLPLTPQGCMVAGVLLAKTPLGLPLYEEAAVQLPRRSTKTTTVQMVLLGLCATIPEFRVVSTAQDGTRASNIMQNMMQMIERKLTREGLELADVGIDQFYRSQGREYILWLNGSKWWVVKPESGAFRSEAADRMWFDEAGELDPVKSSDLEAGALPLMDTRDDAQIIISGTPGLSRQGLFWDYLEQGHKDPDTFGIVDFSAGDHAPLFLTDDAGEVTDEPNEALWFQIHPGLASGLTTIAKIRKRWDKMDRPQFIREYLCVWPPDSTVTALDLQNWANTAGDHLGAPPEGVPWGIGWDVAIGGSSAAVAVAWFDDDDEPHVQVMKHKPGSHWVAPDVAAALLKHPRVPVGYDNIGDNITVAQALGRLEKLRAPHKKRIKALGMKEVGAATATLAQANERLSLHHAEHSGLDTAVRNAAWRESGGSRLFMRLKGMEITCLLACVHALSVAATAKRGAGVSIPDAVTG